VDLRWVDTTFYPDFFEMIVFEIILEIFSFILCHL
jgi:hypothetical protein